MLLHLEKIIRVLFLSFSLSRFCIIMPSAKIAPSMLASDFAHLAAEAKRVVKNGADWLHLGMLLGVFYFLLLLQS